MIGVICGLQSEARALARLLAPAEIEIAVAGASASRAYTQSKELLQRGARILFSVGLAGALDPTLTAGALVTARHVMAAGQQKYEGNPGLIALILQSQANPQSFDASAGVDVPAASLQSKAQLAREGCSFVDMETHGVARAAQEHNRPWAALRAIADDALMPLPEWAMGTVEPDGSLKLGAAIFALLRRPGHLPAALRLSRANEAALATLRHRIAPFLLELAHKRDY